MDDSQKFDLLFGLVIAVSNLWTTYKNRQKIDFETFLACVSKGIVYGVYREAVIPIIAIDNITDINSLRHFTLF